MKYKLTNEGQEIYIVQSIYSGDYDYSFCNTLQEAAVFILNEVGLEGFFKEHDKDCEYDCHEDHYMSKEETLEQIRDTLTEYSASDVIKKAEEGFSWPGELGFIETNEEES